MTHSLLYKNILDYRLKDLNGDGESNHSADNEILCNLIEVIYI